MKKNIFTEIQNGNIPDDLKEIASDLSSSFNESNSDELEKAVQLAYLLYLYDRPECSENIVKEISKIEFNGSYDYWTWIESALILNIRINRLNNHLDVVNALKEKVLAPLSIGDTMQVKVNNRVFNRRLKGETLSFDKVKSAMDSGKIDSEASRRISYLRKLMEISEMGGSEVYPVDKAEAEIYNNEIRLKSILREVDLNTLF